MQKLTFRKEDLTLARINRQVNPPSQTVLPQVVEQFDNKEEVEQLKSVIKGLGAKVQELAEEKNHLSKENAQLTHSTIDHQRLLAQQLATPYKEPDTSHFQQEISSLKELVETKDEHIHTYKSELETLKAHIQILERKIVESQNNKSQLDQSNTSSYLKALFDKQQLEEEVSALKCEKMATSRRLQELSVENASLQKQVELTEDKNRSLFSAIDETEAKRQELHNERMRLQDTLSEEKQLTLSYLHDVKEKELNIASLEAKNHENSLLIQHFEGIQERENALQLAYNELQQNFQELELEQTTLQEAFRRKIEEAASLHELLALRTHDLDTTQTTLETTIRTLHEQESALTELHGTYSIQTEQMHNLELDLTNCREELTSTFNELTHFKTLLSRYSQAEHLSIQLYDIFNEQHGQ